MSDENIIALTLSAGSFLVSLVGLSVSIFSAGQTFERDQVRLKVVPLFGVTPPGASGIYTSNDAITDSGGFLVINVVNRSSFAVTITDVGFEKSRKATRAALTKPQIVGKPGASLPFELAARSEITVIGPDKLSSEYKRAYAKTATGETKTGTSRAFRKFMARQD